MTSHRWNMPVAERCRPHFALRVYLLLPSVCMRVIKACRREKRSEIDSTVFVFAIIVLCQKPRCRLFRRPGWGFLQAEIVGEGSPRELRILSSLMVRPEH